MKKIGKIVLEAIIGCAIVWVFLHMIFYPIAATFFFLRIGELIALQAIACLVVVSVGIIALLTLFTVVLIMEGV